MRTALVNRAVLAALGVWCFALAPSGAAWADAKSHDALPVPVTLREGQGVLQSSAGDIAAFVDIFARLVLLGVFLSDVDRATPPPPSPAPPAGPEDDDHSARSAKPPDAYADYDGWERRPRRRTRDAREGFLLGFGLGGGSLYASGVGHSGALQGNLRMGYGFSDRFQLFGDVSGTGGNLGNVDTTSWTLTLRGQTVLIGDRDGNGLNLNAGFGIGGLTSSYQDGSTNESRAGLALVAGLSYDARLGRSFALSPEFFVSWHAVPNGRGRPNDIATAVGVQLNFLWYGP